MPNASVIALGMVAATVTVHSIGLSLMIRQFARMETGNPLHLFTTTRLLIRTVWALILIHVTEISLWALMYHSFHCLPTWELAFYFSGVTYTTIGYGDVVLPESWRIFGPVEGLTGILMCSLSGAFFFAVFNKIYLKFHID